jgi:hypothetical protein
LALSARRSGPKRSGIASRDEQVIPRAARSSPATPRAKPTGAREGRLIDQPALTAAEIAEQTPTIPLPDGKIRMIYALKNYGGTTITATT